MTNTTGIRSLTAEETNLVTGGSIVFAINPQFNVGISAAISVGGNALSVLAQANVHAGL